MFGDQEAKRIIESVLAYSTGDQTEVVLYSSDAALTRFANGYIHQNVAESNVQLSVRVVLGKRIGIATVNAAHNDAIKRTVDVATEIARCREPDEHFISLPGPTTYQPVDSFAVRTAEFTPEERASAVAVICRKAAESQLIASGAFETSTSELAIGNSEGVFAFQTDTLANVNTVIMSDTSSGYADRYAVDVDQIDVEAVAAEAIDKALRSRNPTRLDPGTYEVILEEYAVSDILDFIAFLGLSAKAVEEERSFMNGNFGRRIVGEGINIWDDAMDPRGIPVAFDFEGVAKQRVDFFINGVANAVCYDSYTAGKEKNKTSTGHALPAGDTYGPLPGNMFLGPGTSTKEEMLASTKRGIWVSRFHYTRDVHPTKVVVTGMTRDGTFLIENGEITRPVNNFRFTQGYLEALNNVLAIGKETKIQRELYPFNRVPALKIAAWNFTGVTEY